MTVLEEEPPLGPKEPEEKTVEDEDVPLSSVSAPTTPEEDTKTIINTKVPLASTVPETGDTMDPVLPLVGMGFSLIGVFGIVLARKKKLI